MTVSTAYLWDKKKARKPVESTLRSRSGHRHCERDRSAERQEKERPVGRMGDSVIFRHRRSDMEQHRMLRAQRVRWGALAVLGLVGWSVIGAMPSRRAGRRTCTGTTHRDHHPRLQVRAHKDAVDSRGNTDGVRGPQRGRGPAWIHLAPLKDNVPLRPTPGGERRIVLA